MKSAPGDEIFGGNIACVVSNASGLRVTARQSIAQRQRFSALQHAGDIFIYRLAALQAASLIAASRAAQHQRAWRHIASAITGGKSRAALTLAA